MKKEALNQIQHLINISELMDQKGFQKESMKSIYDAFVIAEAESYRIASEINNMTKTASKNTEGSNIKELENSFIVTSGIGDWLKNLGKRGVDWLRRGRGAEGLKDLGTRVEGEIGDDVGEGAVKSLRQRGGEFLGRARDDLAEMRFWRNKAKINDQIEKINREILGLEGSIDPESIARKNLLQDRKNLLLKEIDKSEGLTDLGKLTAGTAAVGAAGIGGASALMGGKKRQVEEGSLGEKPLTSISPGTSGLGSSAPYGGSAGMKGFGPATAPSGGNTMMSPSNIMDIQQRIDNLERVVEAIRAKVGV